MLLVRLDVADRARARALIAESYRIRVGSVPAKAAGAKARASAKTAARPRARSAKSGRKVGRTR
jgi:hypothetical protein